MGQASLQHSTNLRKKFSQGGYQELIGHSERPPEVLPEAQLSRQPSTNLRKEFSPGGDHETVGHHDGPPEVLPEGQLSH